MRIRTSRRGRARRARFLSIISLSLLPGSSAWALTPPAIATGGIALGLEPLATVGTAPVDMQQPPDSTDRFFVAGQTSGQVRLIQNGTLQTTPFLSLSSAGV